jgi:hypothetical protein
MGVHAALLDTNGKPFYVPDHVKIEYLEGYSYILLHSPDLPSVPEGTSLPIISIEEAGKLKNVKCDCKYCLPNTPSCIKPEEDK